VDLALGWGAMFDNAHLEGIEISQRSRVYYWSAESLPLPRREAERNSANMPLISGDSQIARRLLWVRKGRLVSLEGHLVEAEAPDGGRWRSYRVRDNIGNGYRELVWVQGFDVEEAKP